MIAFIFSYVFIIGYMASSVTDFILCVIPLFILLIIVTRARPVDVFVFTGEQYELAERFIDVILEDDEYYESARIMQVNPQALEDALKEQG